MNIIAIDKLNANAAVACQGVAGAYSDKCVNSLFSGENTVYKRTFKGVFEAVASGECEYGVLPIENSTAGSVNEVYSLMAQYRLYIAASVKMEINHALLALPDASRESLTKVLSHWQALTQCSEYIDDHRLVAQTAANTAIACSDLALSGDLTRAVIANIDCAELYNLKVIDSNIQNNRINYTRFIVVTNRLVTEPNADIVSVICKVSNQPESLSKLIAVFSNFRANLRKIASQNIPNTVFEVLFFIDFDGNINAPNIKELLYELQKECADFALLGCYKCV